MESASGAPPASGSLRPALRFLRPALRFLRTAALAAAVAWVLLAYGAQVYRIQGSSMAPALRSGERLLVNKVGARFAMIDRGDVIVFDDPKDSGTVMVKRVVGVPGDTVRYRGDDVQVLAAPGTAGSLRAAVAPVASAAGTTPEPLEGSGAVSVVLDAGEFFVLGDNRSGSRDSRHWGALRQEAIIGEAAIRVSPWGRIGRVDP